LPSGYPPGGKRTSTILVSHNFCHFEKRGKPVDFFSKNAIFAN
jgi:hypothetical protein